MGGNTLPFAVYIPQGSGIHYTYFTSDMDIGDGVIMLITAQVYHAVRGNGKRGGIFDFKRAAGKGRPERVVLRPETFPADSPQDAASESGCAPEPSPL